MSFEALVERTKLGEGKLSTSGETAAVIQFNLAFMRKFFTEILDVLFLRKVLLKFVRRLLQGGKIYLFVQSALAPDL